MVGGSVPVVRSERYDLTFKVRSNTENSENSAVCVTPAQPTCVPHSGRDDRCGRFKHTRKKECKSLPIVGAEPPPHLTSPLPPSTTTHCHVQIAFIASDAFGFNSGGTADIVLSCSAMPGPINLIVFTDEQVRKCVALLGERTQ